jgi:hypothetical protein
LCSPAKYDAKEVRALCSGRTLPVLWCDSPEGESVLTLSLTRTDTLRLLQDALESEGGVSDELEEVEEELQDIALELSIPAAKVAPEDEAVDPGMLHVSPLRPHACVPGSLPTDGSRIIPVRARFLSASI